MISLLTDCYLIRSEKSFTLQVFRDMKVVLSLNVLFYYNYSLFISFHNSYKLPGLLEELLFNGKSLNYRMETAMKCEFPEQDVI
jgi:hypothetical protein